MRHTSKEVETGRSLVFDHDIYSSISQEQPSYTAEGQGEYKKRKEKKRKR